MTEPDEEQKLKKEYFVINVYLYDSIKDVFIMNDAMSEEKLV